MSKTVKVRIAVAVDPTGEWSAAGWNSKSKDYDFDAMGCAVETLENNEKRYWLEAELAIPEGTGEVVQPNVIEAN